MSESLIWLLAALALSTAYWLYCGTASARSAAGPKSFFLADRDLPAWGFILAGTGLSFPALIVVGHADLVARDGLAFGGTALCAITVPLAGVMFLKRQWMVGKRYGYVTPAEMLGDYYGGEAIRLCTVIVGLVFAVPFAGLQMSAVAGLIGTLSGGAIDPLFALWVLMGVVFAYTCIGGIRGAAFAGASQTLLLGAGAMAVGAQALWMAGGVSGLEASLVKSGAAASRLDIPGVMQFVRGLGVEPPRGSPWTATMIASYCAALMGLQLAPAFGVLTFATRSPKGFANQQIWAAGGAMGAILLFCVTAAGLGSLAGGAPASPDAGVFAAVIGHLAEPAPWFVGILAVSVLAAAQVFAALNLSAASTMAVRDVYRRFVAPDLDIEGQRRAARIAMGLMTLGALLLATFAPRTNVALGALALGFGFQLLPALAGLIWMNGLTREGVAVGLVAGLVGVVFTEPLGGAIASFFGIHLPWGRWPWTLHSAAWGMALNASACLIVSLISRNGEDLSRRGAFHRFLADAQGRPASSGSLRALAWALTLAWLFFAIGPGAVYGNSAFMGPGFAAGVPSLWAWQIGWWALGVLLLWFLAKRLALSNPPMHRIEPLPRSRRPRSDAAAMGADRMRQTIVILVGLVGVATLANWLFD